MEKPKPKVFISHITEEAKLAEVFKRHILKDFLGLVDVFVSSDSTSIPAGRKWLNEIENALKVAKIEFILCSKESVKRPWINFEAGAGCVKGIPVVPVCHTGMKPADLPIPLNMLQAVEAKDRDGLKKLYDLLAGELGSVTPDADFDKIIKEIETFENKYSVGISQSISTDDLSQLATSSMYYAEPTKVSASDPNSVVPMPSRILKKPRGGISVWVYLHPFERGIRDLENNRYILSHDTNSGQIKKIEGEERYLNVFALSHGAELPESQIPNPIWKLWITNSRGEPWLAKYPDSRDLTTGWHHFLVRWDHDKPLLQLLIDGKKVIDRDDYYKHWPTEYVDHLLIGAWTDKAREHYVETHLCRAQAIYDFPNDDWVAEERKNIPPEVLK